MGIHGLQTFAKANQSLWQKQELKDTKLIIDASNLLVTLFRKLSSDKQSSHYREDIYGGNMVAFADKLRNFFKNLSDCNIEPILIGRGSFYVDQTANDRYQLLREAEIKATERFKAASLISEHNFGETQAMALVLNMVFYKIVIDEFKLKQVRDVFESTRHGTRLANELGCPIVSNDSDFAIMPIDAGWILFDDIWTSKPELVTTADNGTTLDDKPKYTLTCPVYKQSRLFEQVPGLKSDMMPLFGALLRAPKSSRFTSPYEELLQFLKRWQYKGPLVANWSSHKRIANLLTCLAGHMSVNGALLALCAKKKSSWFLRRAILDATKCYHLVDNRNITRELERIYAPADYPELEPGRQPAQVLSNMIAASDLSGTMLDIIFAKPYFGMAVVDDLQLVPSGHIRFRPFGLAIAVLRPKSQVAAAAAAGGDVDATASNDVRRGKWKFVVYDRAVGSGRLVRNEIQALDELDGFGSLQDLHIGTVIQMDVAEKRRLLLATFRCNEELFSQIGSLTSNLFGDDDIEARLCFMVIRYCAIESKLKPMRAFVEAALITLLNYSQADGNTAELKLAACALVSQSQPNTTNGVDNTNSDDEGTSSNSKFRRVMHHVNQFLAGLWSLANINSLLGHPMHNPQVQNYLNCPLIYRLTCKLNSRELDLEQTLGDLGAAADVVDTIDRLVQLVTVD